MMSRSGDQRAPGHHFPTWRPASFPFVFAILLALSVWTPEAGAAPADSADAPRRPGSSRSKEQPETAQSSEHPKTARPAEISLEEKVEILSQEVARLREAQELPASEEERVEVFTGLGPSASKIYRADPGVSLGGYGEWSFSSQLEDTELGAGRNTADLYRFVFYLGYKFSDRLLMNTEIEFEHASTEPNPRGEAGEVTVEFAYLEFLLHDSFRLRTGNLLVPMGFLNRMHEPPTYLGNFRPELERRILPTTWHELGIGAVGSFFDGFSYTAYLLNGLDAAGFSEQGIRGGRQGANQALWEDLSGVVALEYDHLGFWQLGGSWFSGGADQNGASMEALSRFTVSNSVWEIHGQLRWRGLHARAIYSAAAIRGAGDLTLAVNPAPGENLIPERQKGGYAELAYDLAPLLFGSGTSWTLSPWLRWEDLRLQDRVPPLEGRSSNPLLDQRILSFGLQGEPHPQVVLKLEFVRTTTAGIDPSDELRLGAGFSF